ncbi:MAG: hypothetical protein ACI4O7_11370 [Aristaeellaceae bacterium]
MELKRGTHLPFPGMDCVIVGTIGCGSNAIVYEGEYRDATSLHRMHRVLIKELFPYDPDGHIWRDEAQRICRDGAGEAAWQMHRRSFERGNSVHLQLLAQHPEQTGGNLNTYALNQTLYTLLDYSGGRSLDRAMDSPSSRSLPVIVARMRRLLLALSVLHSQGYLHLDISLDNILLIGQGEEERVLLIDYNSVYSRDELRGQGRICFSAKEGFTAPEVQTGMVDAIGPCTDLFAVTCVFFALLTGRPPTLMELSRRLPPDVSDSPPLRDAPATVKEKAAAMLRRGLCALPDMRYGSCGAMLRDLEELERRLAGVGVTHAALWEAGRRSVQRLIRQNPSLCYVEQESGLYPLRIQAEDGASMPAQAWMDAVMAEGGRTSLLVGEGGMGKSTVLLRAALSAVKRYSPARPAVMYLPLMGRKHGESSYILDHILFELRFDAQTQTMEDARHALLALLNPERKAARGAPVQLLVLLDGLNEASGDTAALMEEIRRLSACSALRMVIATRTAPDALPMPRASMVPLEDGDIAAALSAHGLLLPESASVRQLLRTPMMLSLFIQTANSAGGQVQCRSGDGLIEGYLDALCQKAARDAGAAADYRVEAAVRLVLPAIAREIRRQGRPLNDQALYPVVRRCHRVLRGRALSRAFPEWIGHGSEALGDGAENAEAWYGEVVQRILWQKLGLLVRGEDGRYRILHQILQDHLTGVAAQNQRRIRARRARGAVLAVLCLMLLGGAGLAVYETWLKPQPYDTQMSAAVLDAMTVQYVRCGQQYEAMTGMLAGDVTPEACAREIARQGLPVSSTASLSLEGLQQADADVVAWSGLPLDFDSAASLMELPVSRAEEYAAFVRAWQLIRDTPERTSTTAEQLASALTALLEADADIVWVLAQQALYPHVEGMSEQQRKTFDTGIGTLPEIQRDRQVYTELGLAFALEDAQKARHSALLVLNGLTVMSSEAVRQP